MKIKRLRYGGRQKTYKTKRGYKTVYSKPFSRLKKRRKR